MLPKSLHTVRILAAVAAHLRKNDDTRARQSAAYLVNEAAAIIGYRSCGDDPLIVKAAAALARDEEIAAHHADYGRSVVSS